MKKQFLLFFCLWILLSAFGEAPFQKGLELYDKKDFSKAEGAFREAIKKEPANARAYYYLGQILLSKQKILEAKKQLETAVILDPTHKEAWNALGIVDSSVEEYDKALVDFSHALQIDPEFIDAYFNLGLLFIKMPNHLDEAQSYFQEVLKRNPNFPGAHHHLGVVYQEKNQIDQAIVEYRKELAISGNPDTHYNLGLIYLERKKDIQKAKAQFIAVLTVRPKDEQAQIKLNDIMKEERGE